MGHVEASPGLKVGPGLVESLTVMDSGPPSASCAGIGPQLLKTGMNKSLSG